MTTSNRKHVAIIDPAVRVAEVDCFNMIVGLSPYACTYHLPALNGASSFQRETKDAMLAGVIILGSGQSVNESAAWQDHLSQWLESAFQKQVPVLGICYGHQLIAHLFGGKVGYTHPTRDKATGFREVRWSAQAPFKLANGCALVSHAEEVQVLPPSFKCMATRTDCLYEGIYHTSLPIWGMQSHIEATTEFLDHQSIDVGRPVNKEDFMFGRQVLKQFFRLIEKENS